MVSKVLCALMILCAMYSDTTAQHPPSTYKTTYSKTTQGVDYGIALPPDFSPSKNYFLHLCLGGSGPITHRIWAIGDFLGFGEEIGFKPIYFSIDYGTEGFLRETPENKIALVNRFKQAIDEIKQLYPNTLGIMTGSFCEGSTFITHYNLMVPSENRIIAMAPSSSGDVALPTDRSKNSTKIFFTCGSADGNIEGLIRAVPVYRSFGYQCSLYVDLGQTHQLGNTAKRAITLYFKSISDSILAVSTNIIMPNKQSDPLMYSPGKLIAGFTPNGRILKQNNPYLSSSAIIRTNENLLSAGSNPKLTFYAR